MCKCLFPLHHQDKKSKNNENQVIYTWWQMHQTASHCDGKNRLKLGTISEFISTSATKFKFDCFLCIYSLYWMDDLQSFWPCELNDICWALLHSRHYQKYTFMYIFFIHYQLLYSSILQLNGAKSEATKLKWLACGLLAVLCWYFCFHMLFHKNIGNQTMT